MRGLIIVLFMIVSSFAQDNYSKKDIEKMIAKMVVLGFTGTSIDKNSQIYKDIEFGLGGVILFDKDPNDKTKAKNIENKAQLKKADLPAECLPAFSGSGVLVYHHKNRGSHKSPAPPARPAHQPTIDNSATYWR